MGQNRRYDLIGRDIERGDRERDKRGTVIGLSIDEVRATGRRREAREPIPVTAHVQFQIAHVEPREVELSRSPGRIRRCWCAGTAPQVTNIMRGSTPLR